MGGALDPRGKIIIVTGGASGLGAATAQMLEDAGAQTVSFDHEAAPTFSIRCDITDDAAVEQAIAQTLARFGRIDGLVNCAGVGGLGSIATPDGPGDIAAFRRVIDINLIGAFNVARHAAFHMIANSPEGSDGERGLIINACSIASFEGQEGMGPYTAAKAGLASLTLVWARDLSRHGIRSMGIAPGFFATPMTSGIPADLVSELLETAEFPRRPGTAREFAELALFIFRNPMLNGDVIRLDGGTRPPARTRWTAS